MSVREYLERHDQADHLAWLAWFGMHEWADMGIRRKDPYECIVGVHVDQKTWNRWQTKVMSARWELMAAGGKQGVSF